MACFRCSCRAISVLVEGASGTPVNVRPRPRLHVQLVAQQRQLRAFNIRLPLRSQQSQASSETISSDNSAEATPQSNNSYTVEQIQESDQQQIAEAYDAAEDILKGAPTSEQTRLTKTQRRKIERYNKYPTTVSFQAAPATTGADADTNATAPAPIELEDQTVPTVKKMKKKEKWSKEKKRAAAAERQSVADANAPAREPNKTEENATKSKKKERWSDEKKKAAAVDRQAKEDEKKAREHWQIDKDALRKKLGGEEWRPRKRLSPEALEGIRALHAKDPYKFTTPLLAEEFKVSPDAIRRILRSKWKPSEEEEQERAERWNKRGEQIWTQLAASGVRPPRKWRQMGVGRVSRGERPAWKKGGKRTVKDAVPFKGGYTEADVIARNLAAPSTEEEDWDSRIV
ncbi:uncharacterized protein K452DRAFT_283161 [Aplosporella prunicola CBS 121167]|uniref:Required for respiratory growth protein 9, mitochondrial n=1 Tax=Aplosporella prunicola CBS 121167 TaxID=1176127 RepID=A0A6A6BT54_9PEZI|nr:uncharacterized protein K452DRAFT_283161 [Aplosporella prunicola CBS 121167]KAF2146978.1 hypothetical protein K452DRAFT_283161 [Aplosporella prunicola CBS 121167]